MGHKNYSKFSTPFSRQNNEPVEEVNNEVMDNQVTIDEVVAEEPVEAVENTEVVESNNATIAPATTIGVVSGCGKLNVRQRPNIESEILTVISQGTQVTVNLVESTTEDFYKVCTINGVEGYCMKKFITIN